MKVTTKMVLITLFFLVPPITFAGTNDVLVVVNGNSEVNREAYNFIRKVFQQNDIPYNLTATVKPSTVKVGQYKSVVVLNTGLTTGVDPVLQKFITGYTDKKALYLVNLYRGKGDLTVTTFDATTNALGVDGVTAASTWKSSFGGPDPQQMHLEWIQDLVQFLEKA